MDRDEGLPGTMAGMLEKAVKELTRRVGESRERQAVWALAVGATALVETVAMECPHCRLPAPRLFFGDLERWRCAACDGIVPGVPLDAREASRAGGYPPYRPRLE
jgi:hypothetical protein